MPELPEVEALVRRLAPDVVGRPIKAVRVLRPQLVATSDVATFERGLRGRTVISLQRRAKYLRFDLDTGASLWVHLRMTGWFKVMPRAPRDEDRHRLAFFRLGAHRGLAAGTLIFRDPRRFGRMYLETDERTRTARLGPEPLGAAFSPAFLQRMFARRRAPVKQVLLDPLVGAGVGNIYASEACFGARIDPTSPAADLAPAQIAALRRSLRAVLRRAIRIGTTTVSPSHDYRSAAAVRDEFRVYGREGEPCVRCGAPILRLVLGGRSTFACPACQR